MKGPSLYRFLTFSFPREITIGVCCTVLLVIVAYPYQSMSILSYS
ncbi:hypothetical protein GPAL_3405 [Glaciecola pallidula DSM 14239 = ACAM 615]|uniref:Uncharacterized protein n=1 Tax=Brumicola pallidula DSM 14239 = ACAM 615 TaxID=1121922 RepID=K6ZMY7_9ALTE|nr:hypothetical protein GPAL_3405 [Glaciecola pallidula DSM 14239 = ACAM 615]